MDIVERLSLAEAGAPTLLAVTHVHRYELAAQLCSGLRVLDLCCGSGYGSQILAESAASVTGVDNNQGAGDSAREAFGAEPGLEFVCADALDYLDRGLDSEFDAIVLFEGLEHLAEADRALEALRVHAEAGMLVVLSIPNSKAFREQNPHHRTEFDYESAMAAFARFSDPVVLYQFHAEGSMIRAPEEPVLDAQVSMGRQAEPESANHFIGIVNAHRAPAPERWTTRLEVAAEPALNRYMLDLERANRRLWRTNQQLARDRLGVFDSAAAASLKSDKHGQLSPYLEPVAAVGAQLYRGLAKVVLTILPHGLTVLLLRIRDRMRQDPSG